MWDATGWGGMPRGEVGQLDLHARGIGSVCCACLDPVLSSLSLTLLVGPSEISQRMSLRTLPKARFGKRLPCGLTPQVRGMRGTAGPRC